MINYVLPPILFFSIINYVFSNLYFFYHYDFKILDWTELHRYRSTLTKMIIDFFFFNMIKFYSDECWISNTWFRDKTKRLFIIVPLNNQEEKCFFWFSRSRTRYLLPQAKPQHLFSQITTLDSFLQELIILRNIQRLNVFISHLESSLPALVNFFYVFYRNYDVECCLLLYSICQLFLEFI